MKTIPRSAQNLLLISRLVIIFAALQILTSACIHQSPPTTKIAVVAPFTGRYREIGYEALRGARLALTETYNGRHIINQSISIIALDDSGDIRSSIKRANGLQTDPAIVAVIGHWLDATTTAAAPIYAESGIPLLATSAEPISPISGGTTFFRLYPNLPELQTRMQMVATEYGAQAICYCDVIDGADAIASTAGTRPKPSIVGGPLWSLQQFADIADINTSTSYFIIPVPHPAVDLISTEFRHNYHKLYPGASLGWVALHSYEATRIVLSAILTTDQPTPKAVAAALASTDYSSPILDSVRFTADGEWASPQYHVYKWHQGERRQP